MNIDQTKPRDNKYLYIILGIFLALTLSFFVGRWTMPKEIVEVPVKVIVPAVSSSSDTIIPVPLPSIKKDSIQYKEHVIYTESEFNKKLADDYVELDKRFQGIELEKERLKKYLASIEQKDYEIPFEDEYIKIKNHIKAQGEILSFQQDYTIKQREVETVAKVEVPQKKAALYAGAEMGNTTKLDKFVVKGNLFLQMKNEDMINVSYDTDQRIWVGYTFKF